MRRLLLLGLLSLAACKHTAPPPEPPRSGVNVRVPGILDVNVAQSPRPVMVDEYTSSRGGPAR